MVSNKGLHVGIGIAVMVLCTAVVFQLRTEQKMDLTLPSRRVNELSKFYRDKKMQVDKYQRENEYLRDQLKNYNQDQEIMRLKMIAGLIPLTGPGLRITLDDAAKKISEGDDPEFYIVHYYILEGLINELRAAGAEAFAVNRNRIIASSGFSCAGTTILVDTKRLAPPYIVEAIGNPDDLRRALSVPGGFVETEILAFQLKFEMKEEAEIKMPAYKGNILAEHAKPVEEGKE